MAAAAISPQETEADYESDFELDKVNQDTLSDKAVENSQNLNHLSQKSLPLLNAFLENPHRKFSKNIASLREDIR